jgi:hypothetical protein
MEEGSFAPGVVDLLPRTLQLLLVQLELALDRPLVLQLLEADVLLLPGLTIVCNHRGEAEARA